MSHVFSLYADDTVLYFNPPPTGLPSDPPYLRHPGPGRDGPSNHAAGPEPAAASVGPEELRVCVQHPGEGAAHPGRPLQLLLHPVPEHLGETTLPSMHCVFLKPFALISNDKKRKT